jgi:signal transduction histidine kinase/CheY-like chemotaxis protein
MKISLSNKIFVLFFSVISVVIGLIGWYGYNSTKEAYIELAYKLNSQRTIDLAFQLEKELTPITKDISLMTNSYAIDRYFIWINLKENKNAQKWKQIFSDSLIDLLKTKQMYYKLRVFDFDANEIISTKYNKDTNYAKIMPKSKLQNKKGREYISIAKRLPKNNFYISEINLNIEFGEIKIPYRPVLRYSTPLIDSNNELQGIFVASYSASILLNIMENIENQHKKEGVRLFLIDKDTNYIYHSNKDKRWNAQLKHGHQFKKDFFDITKSALNEEVLIRDDKIYSYKKIYPSSMHNDNYWYVVSVVDTKIALSKLKDFKLIFYILLISIFLISFIIIKSYISRLMDPVGKVTKQLKALSNGSVLKQHIHYNAQDEIGDIVKSTAKVVSAIEATIKQANAVSNGDFSSEIELLSKEDKLGLAIRSMTKRLSDISKHATNIANGDFNSSKIEIKSEYDKLGKSLLVMNDTLKNTKFKNDGDLWFSGGISDFSDKLTGLYNLNELLKNALDTMCEHINASAGVIYKIVDEDNLEYKVSYIFKIEDEATKIKMGDGIIGQVASSKKSLHIKHIKDNTVVLKSSFGDIKINEMYIMPLVHENIVHGVVELRKVDKFSNLHIRYLKRVSEILAVAIEKTSKNMQIETLFQESEKAYEELQRASEYKSEFLANMSHELRTPLNSIILLSKLLASNVNENLVEDDVSKLSVINKAGVDLLIIINDILDLSKIESGNIIMDEQVVSSGGIALEIGGLFNVVAKDKGINFIINDEINASFFLDDIKLLQVIKNLLSNSFKFTSRGLVEFSMKKDNQSIIFEVSDSGIGMPQEKLALIFEAFKQVDGTINRKYGGTGLGLSISKNFIDMMGGEINVSSIEGKGSSFKVILPFKEVQQEVKIESYKDIHLDSDMLLNKNILVIDDDSRNIFTLSTLLQDVGAEVLTALNEDQVKEVIDSDEIDIVLIDIILIKSIKVCKTYDNIPIIVMSDKTDSDDEKLCYETGADDCIYKPIDEEELIQKIKGRIA